MLSQQFEKALSSTFSAEYDNKTITMTLSTVQVKERSDQTERFSLLFKSDGSEGRTPIPQQILRVRHDSMGDLDIFIVPVSSEDPGFCYEAIYNLNTDSN